MAAWPRPASTAVARPLPKSPFPHVRGADNLRLHGAGDRRGVGADSSACGSIREIGEGLMTLRLAYRITAGLAVVLALMLAAPSSTPAAGGGQFCGGIFGIPL